MGGLSFLYPVFLVGALAVAIPVVLHLMRRKTEVVVDFPAVHLLEQTPIEQHHRRRIREWILLALRVTALALLALAFARPYLQTLQAGMPAPVTVVALDTSLSLTAPGQFERARAAARNAVEDAPSGHSVALVTFADSANVAVAPTTDRGAVIAAIAQVQPSAAGTRFRTALARASDVIQSGDGTIIVVTDLQQAGWEASDEGAVPDGIDVQVREIAPPVGNVAVTSVRRETDAVVAGVHNFGTSAHAGTARLRIGGKEVAMQSFEVAAQGAAEVRLAAALPARGGAAIAIDDPNGYQPDNTRYVVLDPADAVPVFIVTAEMPASSNAGLYVERALDVADDGRAFAPRAIDGRSFSGLSDDDFGQPGAIFVLGTTTLDRRGRERIANYLREGGRGLLTLGPDVDVATLADTLGTRVAFEADPVETTGRTVTLVAADTRHPIFRPFLDPSGALGDVFVERYRRLNEEGERAVLARFSGAGDALVEHTVGRGRLLVFASDLDNRWNRFPLNPSFVPWAIETTRYLVQGREQRQSFILPDVPASVPALHGIHQVGERTVVVNADVRESNPARTTAEEFLAGIARLGPAGGERQAAVAREQEERQRLWQIGLMVMFLALAGEGLIGRRAA